MERTTIEIKRLKDNPMCAKVLINGQQINGVRSVEYSHYGGEIPTLKLDLCGMKLDVLANINVDELVQLKIT